MRYVLAFIGGGVAGFVTVGLIESINMLLYPLPAGLDINDTAALAEYIAQLPTGAFLVLLVAHAVGAFVAGAVCAAIARQRWYAAALALGIFFLLAGIRNLFAFPHPTWVAVVDVLLYIPCAILGCHLVGGMFGGNRPKAAETDMKAAEATGA